MVLLMQKVTDLEIHLYSPKQNQGNDRDSPLLSLKGAMKMLSKEKKKEKKSFSLGYV